MQHDMHHDAPPAAAPPAAAPPAAAAVAASAGAKDPSGFPGKDLDVARPD